MANLSENTPALAFKKVNADLGGSGSTGSPSYLKLVATDGADFYVFVETDGTLKIATGLPTQDSDGSVVGSQS
jgi:hypothetical protein